ncbi:MAG: hypothetical protein II980_05175 [Clostridia bacterium]|nr:hypothetical protein [Clostridia bacterium]
MTYSRVRKEIEETLGYSVIFSFSDDCRESVFISNEKDLFCYIVRTSANNYELKICDVLFKYIMCLTRSSFSACIDYLLEYKARLSYDYIHSRE